MIKIISQSPEETRSLALAIGQRIIPGTVLALWGDLGAGKTLFAQGLAQGLGIAERVKSPTFMILEEYQGRLPFSHIDAYRLVDDEAYEAGLEECFNGQNIVLVEWPGNLGSLLPQEAINIELQHSFDEEDQWREIIFNVDQGQYPWLEEAIKCGF